MLRPNFLFWLVLLCLTSAVSAQKAKLSYVDSSACCLVSDGRGNSFVITSGSSSTHISVAKFDTKGDLVSRSEIDLKAVIVPFAGAVDAQGRLWIAGKVAATQPFNGSTIGLLLQLDPTGAEVLSQSTIGGQDRPGGTEIHAIAFDQLGNCYVAGITSQIDFPLTPGSFMDKTPVADGAPLRAYRGFVAKLKIGGQGAAPFSITYSTLLGGGAATSAQPPPFIDISALAVDKDGIVTVAGITTSADFPTTAGVFQNKFTGSGQMVFLTRLNSEGSRLVWSTFVGPGSGLPLHLSLDSTGDPVFSGTTADPLYPVTAGAVQRRFFGEAGYNHLFLTKLDSTGARLIFSTFYGLGSSPSTPQVDEQGNIWMTATLDDAASVVLAPNSLSLGRSAIAQFSADGSKVLFSELLPSGVAGKELALNPDGSMTIAGNGFVLHQPRAVPSGLSILGVADSAGSEVTKSMAPGEYISIFGTGLGPVAGAAMEVDSDGRIARILTGTQVLINGIAAPLLYVSSNQINALVPYGVEVGTQLSLKVVTAADSSQTLPFGVVRAQPNIFSVRNADGSPDSLSRPASIGSAITVFVSGAGTLDSQLPDGTVASSPAPAPAVSVAAIIGCSVGKLPQRALVTALSAASVPGIEVNMLRADFQVPEGILIRLLCTIQILLDASVVTGIPIGIRSTPTILYLQSQ